MIGFSSRSRIRTGYAIAFLLLLGSYILMINTVRLLKEESNRVSHSDNLVMQLERLQGAVTQAETSFRGYVITGDSAFLKFYYEGVGRIAGIYKSLDKLTAVDPTLNAQLDTLKNLVEKRSSFFTTGIILFKNTHTLGEELKDKVRSGMIVMVDIRKQIDKMIASEEMQATSKRSKLSGFFQDTQSLIIISLITAALAILYSLFTYNFEHKAKKRADQKAEQYLVQLENNVKELRRINNELNELKSIEKFASTGRIARTIAHEVRNPLTNISLATEQLQDIVNKETDATLLLDMISRNAVRINQLVSDLLNATRFIQLNIQTKNVNALLDETLELAKDRIELYHIQVRKNYAPDVCDIGVDAEKIKLALLNIMVNATEAMENGNGILELKTKNDGNKCIIEITDNGKGMDEETIQKIFDPYFTNKAKGNGLGLTNTQNIVLSHKGFIKVNSNLSKGTTFTITLDKA